MKLLKKHKKPIYTALFFLALMLLCGFAGKAEISDVPPEVLFVQSGLCFALMFALIKVGGLYEACVENLESEEENEYFSEPNDENDSAPAG